MSSNRKLFFLKHSKSSAALVSLGIHVVLIIVALSFVVVRVIQKDDPTFDVKPVHRPRMTLRKLQVPVKIKKRTPEPKLRKRIVSKPTPKTMEIKIPEISGIKGGLGNLGDGGLGGIGFNLELNLFGGDNGTGNELEGTFFDLKMRSKGTPAEMNKDLYNEVIRKFLNSWNLSVLERYYQAPNKKFATSFMLPVMNADEAPKAMPSMMLLSRSNGLPIIMERLPHRQPVDIGFGV